MKYIDQDFLGAQKQETQSAKDELPNPESDEDPYWNQKQARQGEHASLGQHTGLHDEQDETGRSPHNTQGH